jgi:hypothetical protein
MRSHVVLGLSFTAMLGAVGCATGGDTTGETLGGGEPDSGVGAEGDATSGGFDTGSHDDTGASGDSGHPDTGGEPVDSGVIDGALPPPDSGADSAQDSGSALSCASPDPCSAASTSLGTIAGDESGPTVTQMGDTSEWLRLDMQEKDNSIIGHAMTFTADLTSPAGMNFDLYAYLGSAIGTIQCSMPKGQSTLPAGQTDTVTFSWGETTGGIANGSDDSATVMIEVRWVSGSCAPGSTWSLSAHGN